MKSDKIESEHSGVRSAVRVSQDAERSYVIKHGFFSEKENENIYKKNYHTYRQDMFERIAKEFDLLDKPLCDAGCGYGRNLAISHPNSYGIDVYEPALQFCKSLGLQVFKRDIINDDLSDLPKVQALWNSAVIEHVDSPHVFLRKLWSLIENDGLLVLDAPLTGSYLYGLAPFLSTPTRQSDDHVNAFNTATLRFACERAGFETIKVVRLSSKIQKWAPQLPLWMQNVPLAPIGDRVLYVGRKSSQWEYGKKARRRVAENSNGYRPRD